MVDARNIKYTVALLQQNGQKLNITNLVESLSYEENENELAMRINLELANEKYKGKVISGYAKLGVVILIYIQQGKTRKEVARGTIVDWKTMVSSKSSLSLTCYDNLYPLQQSQDYVYYSKGIGTKAAITGIFKHWKVPLEKYAGPNKTHGKLVYKTETVSEIILDILEDAYKKGDEKCVIQSTKGEISILKRGSNQDIYHFGTDNTAVVHNQMSTANMVTRVKVIGKEDGEKKQRVEAVEDGKISFGVRQKIYIRSGDDSIEAAKTAAKKILEEQGNVEKHPSIQSIDVPWIRKGHMVHVAAGTLKGYYYVTGIRHEADSGKMSMDLAFAKKEEDKNTGKPSKGKFQKGDAVILNGTVYRDSYGNGAGRNYKNHKCKITIIVDLSRKCPYHVDGIGWVYPVSIRKEGDYHIQ